MAPQSSQPHSKADHTMQALRQRENELKRARGVVSCAECRRLKLRCDKKLPCSSCVRRGCQSICPNGALSGGQGTRFVLADTEELHLRLIDMSERIRELEDALQTSHADNNADPHPLLCNDLRAIKYVVGHNVATEDDIPRHPHDPLDSFGALKISDDGETRFLGPSAGSEGILLTEVHSGKREEDEQPHPEVPPQLYELARMWPFTPINLPKDDIRATIEAQLPTWERASALCESYLENIGWFHMPVDREQIMEELLPSIYKRISITRVLADSAETIPPKIDVHDLALLFVVFACGAAGDRTQEAKNDEGQLYYQLTRVALGLQPVLESASLSTVQAISMMAVYDIVAIRRDSLEESWRMGSLAASIAGSIGLHRDPGRWNLDPKIMERRRKVFWEIFSVSDWQCLAGGRPPAFVTSSVDVQLPQDPDAITSAEGKTVPSHMIWKIQFLKECVAPVTDRLCADSSPLKYYEILSFDKKIREFDEIEIMHRDVGHSNDDIVSLSKKTRVLFFKSMLRLYLHRNFFAKAITEFPDNPHQPPFGTSFLTVFSSAISILDGLHQNQSSIYFSGWIVRFWPIVAHALECGFVVGSVATRCPRTSYATTASKSLETAIELFHSLKHPVTKNGLPVLLRLREKAQQADYTSCVVPSNILPSSSLSGKEGEALDELSILRGASRLVAHTSDRRGSSTKSSSPAISADSFSPPSGTVLQPEMSATDFLAEPGVQFQSQAPITTIEKDQTPLAFFPDTNAFDWSDLFNQTGEQIALPTDHAASIGVDGQTFASLVPDAFFNASELLHSWDFEGNSFFQF